MPECHRQPQLLEISSALNVTQAVLSCKLASVLVGRAPPGEDGVTWSSKAGHHAMSDSGLLLSLIKLGLYQAR